MVIPGTDGGAESGMCSPDAYEDMVRAASREEAIFLADVAVREIPFDRPVCTDAVRVSDQEYAEWKKMLDEEAGQYDNEPAIRWI